MGVVKKNKPKNEKKDSGQKNENVVKKNVANGKTKNDDGKVKKKKTVSCLQCIKSAKDDGISLNLSLLQLDLIHYNFAIL